jgi:hypothetical protein
MKVSEAPRCIWIGESNNKYTYWIHPIGTDFMEEGGNYIYAEETRPGKWSPLYIGQTDNLHTRLSNHEKEECAKRNGATHIHVHTTPAGEMERLAEERDLIAHLTPTCNDQIPS